jgi:hypothetical protein
MRCLLSGCLLNVGFAAGRPIKWGKYRVSSWAETFGAGGLRLGIEHFLRVGE